MARGTRRSGKSYSSNEPSSPLHGHLDLLGILFVAVLERASARTGGDSHERPREHRSRAVRRSQRPHGQRYRQEHGKTLSAIASRITVCAFGRFEGGFCGGCTSHTQPAMPFLSRTPGPPPSRAMNSTPANSSLARTHSGDSGLDPMLFSLANFALFPGGQ